MATDRVGREFIMWYLKTAFDAYRKVEHAVQSRFTGCSRQHFLRLQAMKSLCIRHKFDADAPQKDELEELRRRIAYLEARLKKNGVPKPSRKPTSKRPSRKCNLLSQDPLLDFSCRILRQGCSGRPRAPAP